MNLLLAWLLMLVLHASVLLLAAWVLDSAIRLRSSWRELLWRTALFGALLTATVQALVPEQSFIGRWHWAVSAISLPQAALAAPVMATASSVTPAAAATTAPATAHIPTGHTFIQVPALADPPGFAPTNSTNDWATLLLSLWALGFVIAMTRLLGALSLLRSDLSRALPVSRVDVLADLSELSADVGVGAPNLLQLEGLPGPIAACGARIVLPAWALDTLDRAQLRAMLAHELGHVVRGDARWKLQVAAWRALLWFVPPAAVAQRRLDEIAELACDAFAAGHTGDKHSLAECLAACAEHHIHGEAPWLAPAMATRPSSLIHRIERLLEGAAMETTTSRALPPSLAALALAAAVFWLPAIAIDAGRAHAAPSGIAAASAKPETPAVAAPSATAATPTPPTPRPSGSSHTSVSVQSDDDGNDTMTVSLSDDGHKFSARVEGKIAFSDDETQVTGIGGAGTATFEETRGGVKRRLELTDHGGKLVRRYFVDRSERPLDDEGRQWVASVVLQLVRSGIGAQARTKRLFDAGGAPRVLAEIERIPTDYVRGIYLTALMALGKLAPADVDHAVRLAGDMHSDYERRQALTAVFKAQALDAPEQVTFLHQALRFDSDYERAELLVGVVPRLADNGAVRQAWLDAALKVQSDYERRRTLQTMLDGAGLDVAQISAVIDASSSMTSDYEHRELLVAAARQVKDPDTIAAAYARSTAKFSSDYERREALQALLHSGKLGSEGTLAILDSASHIGSSYDCRELLVALARVMPQDAAVEQRYRELAGRLPEYDRGEAERALR